jgi:predicted MPP superfamily phosphohydrolase
VKPEQTRQTVLRPPASEPESQARPAPARLSRRQFTLRILALLGTLTATESLYETNRVQVTRHQVPMPGLRSPMRVVQLSDLHRSDWVSEGFIARIVAQTETLQGDFIALTGDFVTGLSEYTDSCAGQLRRLCPPLGIAGVLGNHDYWCDIGRGSPAVAATLARVGVQMLINRNVLLDNGLRVVGVDDCRAGKPDYAAAFRDVRPGEPVLTLTHNPLAFDRLRAYSCLTLAGHTHGGQINLPFLTHTVVGERTRYLKGWFCEPNQPGRMYVSRGLGVIGIPLRFRAQAEISVFDLVPARFRP